MDGNGNLIQSTKDIRLPPRAIRLRNGGEVSALRAGVSIRKWDEPDISGDQDGYEIQIRPVDYVMAGIGWWDSQARTNLSKRRRLVIRTTFGTAIAPPTMWNFIEQ